MPFYNPIQTWIVRKPMIVYPCHGIEEHIPRDVNPEKGESKIQYHLKSIRNRNAEEIAIINNLGEYNISILWDHEGDLMTDWWTFLQVEEWGSGPLAYVNVFRKLEPDKDIGDSAGGGLMVLGAEEKFRRTFKDLQDYIDADRTKHHIMEELKDIMSGKDYFISSNE